ncbi:hypothetical protein [Erythrobacter crassostreae]|uniref:Chemotaxis protein n=1 Tax=Erythrobacter crassostreae TaxID=2828328 RepID=A0A9X1JKF3_9SPHN|nr:hypothetical protein [Erythrobacter crassostrea]MBV7258985.1 hypothetical protein [Erythrobacter crassostrea]
MKALLKQYLTSLKERDELDVILPDILSEVGFNVISRPKRGTKQYGVDVAAIGTWPKTGGKALFLLSIKSGDLKRTDWDVGQQALRPSLNEILDYYIPKHIPKRYQDLPVVIAMCFGGDIHEDIRPTVDSFVDKHTVAQQIEFEEWNGDHLADLIATGLLREKIFPNEVQSNFRKAVAFVDEPQVCLTHFYGVIAELASQDFKTKAARLTAVRQIYLAAWTIFVWCRDVKNLEAAYLCSELAVLWTWHLTRDQFEKRSKVAKELESAVNKIIQLQRSIGGAYLEEHVYPLAEARDALASSVPSSSPLDVNLKLFDAIGRVALHGFWILLTRNRLPDDTADDVLQQFNTEIERVERTLINMVENNPVYFTPIKDDHAIEIMLVCLFLAQQGRHDFIHKWGEQITYATIMAYRRGGYYPCTLQEYTDLAEHPQPSDEYRKEVTAGSILYPTLAIWLAIVRHEQALSDLADFSAKNMEHCTFQLWLPDVVTEEHLYSNSARHGVGLDGFDLENGSANVIELIEKEIEASQAFYELSASKADLWPIIMMACRQYRLPLPPHFWTLAITQPEEAN